jgi:hypothetical protein
MTGGPEPRAEVMSENARKLFLIEDRIAVATHGLATIGDRTIGALMDDFEQATTDSVEAYAAALGTYFAGALSAVTPPGRGDLLKANRLVWPLDFLVTGYDDEVGRAFDVKARPGDSRVELLDPSTDNPGVIPRGQADAIGRLLDGFDRQGLKDARIAIASEDQEKLALLSYDLILPQELEAAVEFAEFLISTQFGAQRFSYGTYASRSRVPGCGGQIRAVTIAPDGGQWVRGAEPSLLDQLPEDPEQAGEALERAQRSA